ncbi:MAG: DUF488 family protein [Acidimicrobiia bacterium]
MTDGTKLFTFGHGTAPQEEIIAILRRAEIESVVDVRIAPGSRRHPHVARVELERWLPDAGIAYRWEPRLGGRRRPAPNSPDTAWRDDAFRGYAGWMRTAEFNAAVDALLEDATHAHTTVMCSESLWWRCHRRLIADASVLLKLVPVVHVMHDGRDTAHEATEWARVTSSRTIVYDIDRSALPFDS